MNFPKIRSYRHWLAPFLLTLVIYATIPIGLPLASFLLGKTPFAAISNVIFCALGVFLILFLYGRIGLRKPGTYAWIAFVLTSFAFVVMTLERPIEKIHLMEYALLGNLLYRASLHHTRAGDIKIAARSPQSTGIEGLLRTKAYFAVILMITAIGWGDEFLQYLTPGRVYDIQDIQFNVFGGIFGLIFSIVVEREKDLSPR